MLPNELAEYLWQLTAKHRISGFQGATLLALLACNLNKHAPTRPEIANHCTHSARATYDALRDLSAPGGPVLERAGRFALHRFAYTFPKTDALPGSAISAAPETHDAGTQQDDGQPQNTRERAQARGENAPPDCNAPPRAEKAVSSSEVNGNGALKAPRENDVHSKTGALLCEFAERVCKMTNAAAAVLHALEQYGAEIIAAALEQYHYAYTRRNREAGNPPGQLLAWCKTPGKMDPLPGHALRFAAWVSKVEQIRNTPAQQPERVKFVSAPVALLKPSGILAQSDKTTPAQPALEATPGEAPPANDKAPQSP